MGISGEKIWQPPMESLLAELECRGPSRDVSGNKDRMEDSGKFVKLKMW